MGAAVIKLADPRRTDRITHLAMLCVRSSTLFSVTGRMELTDHWLREIQMVYPGECKRIK